MAFDQANISICKTCESVVGCVVRDPYLFRLKFCLLAYLHICRLGGAGARARAGVQMFTVHALFTVIFCLLNVRGRFASQSAHNGARWRHQLLVMVRKSLSLCSA